MKAWNIYGTNVPNILKENSRIKQDRNHKHEDIYSTLLLCFFCISCTASNVDEQTKFALLAIQDNIVSTDFSALVEITSSSIKEPSKIEASMGNDELVAVNYSTSVLENYLGKKVNAIIFTQYVEKNEGLDNLSKGKLIVSLCTENDGTYYLPDIGYELPPEAALIEKAREIKMLLINKKLSLHRDENNYACNSSQY